MSRTDDDGSLLSRWAQRKRAVAEQEKAEQEQADIEAKAEVALANPEPIDTAAEPEEETDEQILERLGLPDPDSMEKGDDFSAFMTSTVPARIRNRALRKLWISNPVLANLDELVDYGEDFTDAATVIENLQTAYQVGRGFMRDEDYADPDIDDEADDEAELAESEQADAAGEDSAHAEAEADSTGQPITDADRPTSQHFGEDTTIDARRATDDAPSSAAGVESVGSTFPSQAATDDTGPQIANDAELVTKRRQRMRFRFSEAR